MSKYHSLSVKDLAQSLRNFGVDLNVQNKSFANGSDHPQSASDWIGKIASEILGKKNIVFDLRLGEDKIKKMDGISVNGIFSLMDDAHSWVVHHAQEKLKKASPIGAMYAINDGKLTLNTENSCLFMSRDEDEYERWLSEHEFDDDNNIISEPSWSAPSYEWKSHSGLIMTDEHRIMQELLTAFQWTCDILNYQQDQTGYAIANDYLNISSKIYSWFNKNCDSEYFQHYVDGKLFNPLKEHLREKSERKPEEISEEDILKWFYRYPKEVNANLIANKNFNEEHFLTTHPTWIIFYGYKEEEKKEILKIYDDSLKMINGKNDKETEKLKKQFSESYLWKYYNLRSSETYIEELELELTALNNNLNIKDYDIYFRKQEIEYLIKREREVELHGKNIREIYPNLPSFFKPLIQYVNYYKVNGFNCLFFNHDFQSFLYNPLHIKKDETNKISRPIWTADERKNTSDSLLTVVSMLEGVLNQFNCDFLATEQSGIDAVREVITLFNFLANLLNCLCYVESEFCSVCYRTKSNKKYCSEHKTTGTEEPELRWALNIQDYFVAQLAWHEKECLFFEKELFVNPAATLNSDNNSIRSIDYCIEDKLLYFNSLIEKPDSALKFDLTSIDKSTRIELNKLSRQLYLLQKLSIRPLDEKMEQLYSILIWEHTYFSYRITEIAESLKDPKIKPNKKYELESEEKIIVAIKNTINLSAFLKIWFYGIEQFFSNNYLSPQLKTLLNFNEFQWVKKGFDRYSNVFIEHSDQPDYDFLIKSIIRQSVWMNVDLILQNDPSVAKIDPVKVFTLYKNGTPLKDIGAILSPAKPVSENSVKTTLSRYLGKEFMKDKLEHLEQAVADLKKKYPNRIVDLSDLTVPDKKFIGNYIVSKLGLGIVFPTAAITIAIDEFLKSKA